MRFRTIPEAMAITRTTKTTTQIRFEMCFDDKQAKEWGALAEEIGLNQPQTLANALAMYMRCRQAEQDGGKVVVQRPGKPDEIIYGF